MWLTASVMGHPVEAAPGNTPAGAQPVFYRTTTVDGLSIFYREAGPQDAPTILLLHGLPSSSRMFEPLLTRLSDRYHMIAPDYPGFGHSDSPSPKEFAYTFDHIASVMDHFTQAVGLSHYTLYMQDYGGPVGFRMALAHPERVDGVDHPGRRRARHGPRRQLEHPAPILGGSCRSRGRTQDEPSLAGDDPDTARGQ